MMDPFCQRPLTKPNSSLLAFPQFPNPLTESVVRELFTPTPDELRWVWHTSSVPEARLGLLCLLVVSPSRAVPRAGVDSCLDCRIPGPTRGSRCLDALGIPEANTRPSSGRNSPLPRRSRVEPGGGGARDRDDAAHRHARGEQSGALP